MGTRPQNMLDLAKVLEEAIERDLTEIRSEIQREEAEFVELHDDHNRYLRSLTMLEECMSARLGVPSMYGVTQIVAERIDDTVRQRFQNALADDCPRIITLVTPELPAQSTPPQAEPELPDLSKPPQAQPELPASGEIVLDDPEPAVDDDDERSIEERIRDLLAKVGSRSARQIGAQIGVEKSVVYAALHGSKWFRMEKGNDELPEHNRPWQLTAAGER